MLTFLLLCVVTSSVVGEFSTYPSIYWNPWNPIFACEDPTINVRIGDTINFLCPSDEYKFYVPPSTDVNVIHENLWFLNDQEDAYNSCNATGGRQLLRCDDQPNSAKYYTISFRDVPTSANALEFAKGKTYYLIGTGFRVVDELDSRVGGSCERTQGGGQFKLRLKIKVCDNDEQCDICKSEGCYYKDCKKTCTPWSVRSVLSSEGQCLKMETRECNHPFLQDKSRTEYRESNQSDAECNKSTAQIGQQRGERRCDSSSSQTFTVLFVISLVVIVALLLLLCYQRWCGRNKGVQQDAEHQKEALNGVSPGKTNIGYRNSTTKISFHLPKVQLFRSNSNNKTST